MKKASPSQSTSAAETLKNFAEKVATGANVNQLKALVRLRSAAEMSTSQRRLYTMKAGVELIIVGTGNSTS